MVDRLWRNGTWVANLTRIVRLSMVPSTITTMVILAGGLLYLGQNSVNVRTSLRSDVESTLDVVAVRLQSNVAKITAAMSGLVTLVELDPEMTTERFTRAAAATMRLNPGILRISLAPGDVVSTVVPADDKRRRIGVRLDRFYSQRTASSRARFLAQPVIGNRVELPDGTAGFDTYLPISVTKNGVVTFWGTLEVLIADQAIFKDAIHDGREATRDGRIRSADRRDLPVMVSIRDTSIPSRTGEAFLGTNRDFEANPVLRDVRIAGGTWQLAGLHPGGWNQRPANEGIITVLILLGALIANVPIVFTSWIMNARQVALLALDQRNQDLLTMSRRLNLALESSSFAVWEIDLESQTRIWDERMFELHGLPFDPHAAMATRPERDAWKVNIHPDDLEKAERAWRRTVQTLGTYEDEYRIVADGRIRHVRHAGLFHQAGDGQRKVTGISWDITEDVERTAALIAAKALAEAQTADLAAAKDRIEHNALHDPLTGLGNRRMLDRVLNGLLYQGANGPEGAFEAALQTFSPAGVPAVMPAIASAFSPAFAPPVARPVALLHLDLDRFKQINDTLGHAAGDAMLIHAARILQEHTGPDDLVARIGGDEFVIVVADADEAGLSALSDSIIAAMRQPVDHAGTTCRFGVSVGIAVSDASTDARSLLVNADIALYRAKQNGRNRHVFFTEALQSDIIKNKRIADDILEGIERDEFTAWYQPQFDAETLALCGVEALIRWEHPRDGILAPAAFLSIAEDLNVMAILDRIIMNRALIDMARWTAAGITVPKVSVNVSAKRLRDPLLAESLAGLSFTPGQLCFELVESIFLDGDEEVLTRNIAAVKALGIDIDIDDFGTGHTSLVSLLKIKPTRLKIDRQLVSPMTSSAREQALVRAIIEIGHSLGIQTVAEGVETMAHAEMLAMLGCNALQGYALSRPLSAEALAAFATSDMPFGNAPMAQAKRLPLAS